MITKITAGNNFSIKVSVVKAQYETSGQIWVDFDIVQCKDVHVNLICTKHQTTIPLEWSIDESANNIILCKIEGRWLHTGAIYGLEITGFDSEDNAWRYYDNNLFAVVNTTAQSYMNAELMDDPLLVNAKASLAVNTIHGPQGPQGDIGPRGERGADGTVSFEDLTPEQKESLMGEQGPQGAIGLTGPQGEIGPQGPAGDDTNAEDFWFVEPDLSSLLRFDDENLYIPFLKIFHYTPENGVEDVTLTECMMDNDPDRPTDKSSFNTWLSTNYGVVLSTTPNNVWSYARSGQLRTDITLFIDNSVEGGAVMDVNVATLQITDASTNDVLYRRSFNKSDWAMDIVNPDAIDVVKLDVVEELPVTLEQDHIYMVAPQLEFKTINNESIIGTGDIQISSGTQGPQGAAGPQGAKGDTGVQGPAGDVANTKGFWFVEPDLIQSMRFNDENLYIPFLKILHYTPENGLEDVTLTECKMGNDPDRPTDKSSFNKWLMTNYGVVLSITPDDAWSYARLSQVRSDITLFIDNSVEGGAVMDVNVATLEISDVSINKAIYRRSFNKSDWVMDIVNSAGEAGPQGNQGAKGDTGAQGPQGEAAAGGEPGFIKVGNGIVSYNATGYYTNLGNRAMIQGEGSSPNYMIKATGFNSHAEGERTRAQGSNSHAEGYYTQATTDNSHAEGAGTQATAGNSHAEGYYTQAHNYAEHAAGHYNSSPTISQYGFSGNQSAIISSIGNGNSNANRHNAFEVRQNGDIYYSDTEKIDGSTIHFYDAPMRKLQDAMVTSTTNGLKFEIVASLPATQDATTVYLVTSENALYYGSTKIIQGTT